MVTKTALSFCSSERENCIDLEKLLVLEGVNDYKFIKINNIEDLTEKLNGLDKNLAVSHVFFEFHGHTSSDNSTSIIFLNNKNYIRIDTTLNPSHQLEFLHPFTNEKTVKEISAYNSIKINENGVENMISEGNPFAPLHKLLTDEPKIFFTSCFLFSGNEKQVLKKAELIFKLVSPQGGDLYGPIWAHDPYSTIKSAFLPPDLYIINHIKHFIFNLPSLLVYQIYAILNMDFYTYIDYLLSTFYTINDNSKFRYRLLGYKASMKGESSLISLSGVSYLCDLFYSDFKSKNN
ncbi:MAG: hypothetical protein K2X39_01125 [Silvanigrellaceae bacterium]|nr:hypothetical protein [Silvanigrellaceae bacterium]